MVVSPSWIRWTRVGATHEEHLVFIVLLIVVVSNAVCFNSVEFSYCTRFVWKCLFTPSKMVFWSIWPINREYCHRHPRKTLPCAETRHITYRLLIIEWWLMLRRPIADTPNACHCARSPFQSCHWGICRSKKCREVWCEMTRKVCPVTKVCSSVMWSIATITVATC